MCDCAEELERRKRDTAQAQLGLGGLHNGGGPHAVLRGSGSNAGPRGKSRGGASFGDGRGKGGQGGSSDGYQYWLPLLGSSAVLGILALVYWTTGLGATVRERAATVWREKRQAVWGKVLDSMCTNYLKDPCGGLRIEGSKRKWPDAVDEKPEIVIELDDDEISDEEEDS